jgi:transposase
VFEAKAARGALRGEQAVAQLEARRGMHQTMINAWRKQAIPGMSGVCSGKAETAGSARKSEIDQLGAKIGQPVVERDFLRRATGR